MADVSLRVFGTPEQALRRRWLHPDGYYETEPVEETDEQDKDEWVEHTPPPPPPSPPSPSYTPSMADRIISFLYHLTAVTFFVFMKLHTDTVLARLKQDRELVIPDSDTYGGMWKFLTHLNFHAQGGYFALALLCDVTPWASGELNKFRDFIFTTIIFPCALVVTSMFWIFTQLVGEFAAGPVTGAFVQILESHPLINHTWHTAIGFAVVIEVLLVYHRYTANTDALKTMFIWNSAYAFWIYWCFYYAGTLPYPLFYNLGPYLMPLVFTLFFIVSVISYFTGKKITCWSWAGEVEG